MAIYNSPKMWSQHVEIHIINRGLHWSYIWYADSKFGLIIVQNILAWTLGRESGGKVRVKMQHYRDGWRSTNVLVNHMKDIHKVKDNQPLSAGCGQKCAFNILNGSEAGRGQNIPTIEESKKFWPTTNPNSTAQTGQHQKAVEDIPPQPHNTIPTWVEHNLQTVPTIPPGSLTDWTDLCQANGGGVAKVKGRECSPHTTSTGHANNAQLQKARPSIN